VEYMKKLREENADAYRRQFGDYIKNGIEPEKIEAIWTSAHAAIRKNPLHVPKPHKEVLVHKRFHPKKKNNKQRKNRIKQKLASLEKRGAVVN